MGKLRISMHLTAHYTLCITFMLVTHTYTFAIDNVEQGHVEPPEPASVETADYE
jgi:hypothetical protein